MAAAVIHWSTDDWKTCHDQTTHDTGLGIQLADLPTEALPKGAQIKFTFFWNEARHWEGVDYSVKVIKPLKGQ